MKFVAALFGLTLLANTPKGLAGGMAGQTSIPRIARIGRIHIGLSTQDELARTWGEGKTIIGGHPNSGRLWRVQGTSWILKTDGFEYSTRGLVVDSLAIYRDPQSFSSPELLDSVPNTRLPRSAFAWAGEISPGMSRHQVVEFLKQRSLPIHFTPDGCQTAASGFSPLSSSMDPLQTWTISFVFTNGTLSSLTMAAEVKPRQI
jgi:hypothetical protein